MIDFSYLQAPRRCPFLNVKKIKEPLKATTHGCNMDKIYWLVRLCCDWETSYAAVESVKSKFAECSVLVAISSNRNKVFCNSCETTGVMIALNAQFFWRGVKSSWDSLRDGCDTVLQLKTRCSSIGREVDLNVEVSRNLCATNHCV